MFFSVDAENYLHKGHHPFLIKVIKKLKIRGMGHVGNAGGGKGVSWGRYASIVISRYTVDMYETIKE